MVFLKIMPDAVHRMEELSKKMRRKYDPCNDDTEEEKKDNSSITIDEYYNTHDVNNKVEYNVIRPTRDSSLGDALKATELSLVFSNDAATTTPLEEDDEEDIIGKVVTGPMMKTVVEYTMLPVVVKGSAKRIRGGGGNGDAGSGGTASTVPTPTPTPTPAPAPATNTATIGAGAGSGATAGGTIQTLTTTAAASVPNATPSAPLPGKPTTSTSTATTTTSTSSSLNVTTTTTGATATATTEKVPSSDTQPAPTTSSTNPTIPLPSWYTSDTVSVLERRCLPEWFDHSAAHRTAETYITAREAILAKARATPDFYITGTVVRRSIAGDVGSLLRLHSFMTVWGMINGSAIGESTPTQVRPGALVELVQPLCLDHLKKADIKVEWSKDASSRLTRAVVGQVTGKKKRKLNPSSSNNGNDADMTAVEEIDWDAVATEVGNGASSDDCCREFLRMPIEVDDEINDSSSKTLNSSHNDDLPPPASVKSNGDAMDVDDAKPRPTTVTSNGKVEQARTKSQAGLKHINSTREDVIRELMQGVRPEVIQAAANAAFKATDDVKEAQKATLLAVIANNAMESAKEEEATVDDLMYEVLNQRMRKLERRADFLDDAEGMLEAERVALELERRDLYAMRCRHWLGD